MIFMTSSLQLIWLFELQLSQSWVTEYSSSSGQFAKDLNYNYRLAVDTYRRLSIDFLVLSWVLTSIVTIAHWLMPIMIIYRWELLRSISLHINYYTWFYLFWMQMKLIFITYSRMTQEIIPKRQWKWHTSNFCGEVRFNWCSFCYEIANTTVKSILYANCFEWV